VPTVAWASLAGVGHALADYGAALFWVAGYALLGTLVAVLRSVPVALAVGIAWAGPFEHLLQEAWDPAGRVFPGLLLEAFVAGGTPDVTAGQAFATLTVYLALASRGRPRLQPARRHHRVTPGRTGSVANAVARTLASPGHTKASASSARALERRPKRASRSGS
jgi:hypothetical protein